MADAKTLYVDLTVLKNKVTVLGKLERSLADVKSAISTLEGNTGTFWDGSAHDVFVENQTSLSTDIDRLKTQVGQSRENLSQAVLAYEKVEKEVDTLVDDLSTADIF